jgi:4-hydroxy-3-polyprenylbenzoate decarboxylase
LTTAKTRAGQGGALGEWAVKQEVARGVRLVAVVDHETDPTDFEEVMWTLLNNIDPERDVRIVGAPDGPAFVMDGTPKLSAEGFNRDWPDKITMTEEVKRKVDAIMARLEGEPVGSS